ncbi:hypothetical protein ACFQX4_27300 [Roseomonas sp. GCM10028921]
MIERKRATVEVIVSEEKVAEIRSAAEQRVPAVTARSPTWGVPEGTLDSTIMLSAYPAGYAPYLTLRQQTALVLGNPRHEHVALSERRCPNMRCYAIEVKPTGAPSIAFVFRQDGRELYPYAFITNGQPELLNNTADAGQLAVFMATIASLPEVSVGYFQTVEFARRAQGTAPAGPSR